MPVPDDDSICRFIRTTDWSTVHNKPKAKSLKGRELSVWHEGRLLDQGEGLQDLQIESLAGSGQLNLTAGDYLDIAKEVSSRMKTSLQVRVEWRSEDQYVKGPWRKWRDAHAQVEIVGNSWEHFPPPFRDLVIITAQRKNGLIAPEVTESEP